MLLTEFRFGKTRRPSSTRVCFLTGQECAGLGGAGPITRDTAPQALWSPAPCPRPWARRECRHIPRGGEGCSKLQIHLARHPAVAPQDPRGRAFVHSLAWHTHLRPVTSDPADLSSLFPYSSSLVWVPSCPALLRPTSSQSSSRSHLKRCFFQKMPRLG